MEQTSKDHEHNEQINIDEITIYTSYEVLEDGTRIFSAED